MGHPISIEDIGEPDICEKFVFDNTLESNIFCMTDSKVIEFDIKTRQKGKELIKFERNTSQRIDLPNMFACD